MLRSPLRASRWLVLLLICSLIASAIVVQPQAQAATDLSLGVDAQVADAQRDGPSDLQREVIPARSRRSHA